jgi:hypothetical protein
MDDQVLLTAWRRISKWSKSTNLTGGYMALGTSRAHRLWITHLFLFPLFTGLFRMGDSVAHFVFPFFSPHFFITCSPLPYHPT